jgi:hypothetical protein
MRGGHSVGQHEGRRAGHRLDGQCGAFGSIAATWAGVFAIRRTRRGPVPKRSCRHTARPAIPRYCWYAFGYRTCTMSTMRLSPLALTAALQLTLSACGSSTGSATTKDASSSDAGDAGEFLASCTFPDGSSHGECAHGRSCVWNGSCDPGPDGSPPNCGMVCANCSQPPTMETRISCAALDAGGADGSSGADTGGKDGGGGSGDDVGSTDGGSGNDVGSTDGGSGDDVGSTDGGSGADCITAGCPTGHVCVEDQFFGHFLPPPDGGTCPSGTELADSGTCNETPTYHCGVFPAGCSGTPTCTCAQPLCAATPNYMCQTATASLVHCVFDAP